MYWTKRYANKQNNIWFNSSSNRSFYDYYKIHYFSNANHKLHPINNSKNGSSSCLVMINKTLFATLIINAVNENMNNITQLQTLQRIPHPALLHFYGKSVTKWDSEWLGT